MPLFLAIYIGTTNDTNGNPRRGWYVSRLDGTMPTAFVDEGYHGRDALYLALLPETDADRNPNGSRKYEWRDRARAMVHESGRIEVTPGEYRSARKLPGVKL